MVHGNDAKNTSQPAGPKLAAKNPPFSCKAKTIKVATKRMSKKSNTAPSTTSAARAMKQIIREAKTPTPMTTTTNHVGEDMEK